MKRFKLFFACLLMAVLSIGQVWAAEELKATLDFTTNDAWKLPVGSGNGITTATDYSDGNYTVNLSATTKYYFNSDGYLMIGKSGSKITLPAFSWKTTKIVVTGRTGASTGTKQNIYVGETAVSTETKGCTGANTYNIASANQAAGNVYVFQVTSNHNAQVTKIEIYGEAAGPSDACATPSFSPAASAVVSGTQVSISCSTDGAAIHYTTDGTDPTASSATYTSAITVTSDMTIKAIAIKDGLDNSSVASATYTVLTPKTIAQVLSDISTTEGAEFLLNDVTVTYAYGSNVYVKDATGYLMVYSSISGAANGKVLQGLCGKAKLYNGLPEVSSVTKAPTLSDGTAVEPIAQNAYPTDADLNKYVTLEDVTFASAATLSGTVVNVNGTFDNATLIIRNTFKLNGVSLTAGTPYRVVGIVQKYNDNFQVYPISFEEIVTETQVATPTFSPAAGTYTSVQNVTISCETTGATIHYTTNGDEPTASSPAYSSAIEVGESMTIKAIAMKEGLDDSNVASAAYTINLPLPEHTFQVTHHFSTGEGFEFPTGWGGSYAEHEIAYTDDKVHFASASKQTSNITDRPVVKDGAISLILTNSSKLISAVRFDYAQWGTKAQTLTMKYSTDGGETYKNFDPVVSSTDFALQVLTMPEGVNAIQVTGSNSSSQVGLTSIAFDLTNKPIVTKTVTITTPTNGTLTVMNGEDAVSSGDEVEVGSVLTITATPAEGYKLTEVTVNGSAYAESTLTLTENVTIAATFEENLAPLVTSYDLSEIGVVTSHLNGERVGDKVNLPLTAASCSKVFRGWDADPDCATAPTYAPGAEYELALNNKLYAVYADPAASATWNVATSLEAGDVVVISTNTGYTAHEMKTAGAISSSLFSCLASTYNADNSQITALAEGTLQFTVGGNATDGWTLMNGTKYLKVTAAKKVNLVNDEETWNISFSGNNATLASATGDLTAYSIQYNYNSGNDRFTAYNTNQVAISLYKQVASYENYSTDCQAQVATPTFSPAAGTYTEAQNVTIACETEDVTIYYTTNGDAPTTSSTEYAAAIPVNESMTIKAIAVKSGMTNSAIASAAYTINLPLSTMDQIFAAANAAGTTATDVNITFGNWVVSGVSTNGKNVFVTDGTKGFIIFDSGANMGFAVGNVLSGTVACKVQLYKGAAELTTLSSSTEGLSVATGGVITPVVKTIDALSGINTGAPVIINSVQFDGEYLTDGANSIKPYNALYADAAFTENTYYNVTGIYQQFDATKEILPRSVADIEALVLDDPELSYTPNSTSLVLGQALSTPTFNNPHELAVTYSVSGDAVATVSNTGVIALVENATGTAVITASFAGNAQYAAGNATFTITVSEPVDAKNVVIIAEYDSKFYALTTNVSNKTAAAVEVEKDGDKIVVASEDDKAAIQWKKITSGENTTFQDANDKYLKGVSNGGDLSLVDAVCNWSWDGTNNCYAIGSRSFIYRESANGFKNYSIGNAGTSDYSAIAEVIEIDPANIVITSKVDPELAYTPKELEIAAEDVASWSAPVLGYVEGFDGLAAISYESSNEAVATVSDAGEIALAGGYGTATITATFGGNTNYLAGSATYTITVNAPAPVPTGTTYTKVTSTDDITDGEYLIVYEGDATHAAMAFNGSLDNIDQSMVGVAVTINEGVIAGTTAIDAATFTIDVTAGTLQSASGYYIGRETYDNGMDKSTETAYTNTFAISEGNAVITGAGNCTLRYNYASDQLRFRYYKNGQQAIQLYKKDTPEPTSEDVRTGLELNRYYTICLGKNVTAATGATFWNLKNRNEAETEVYLEEVTLPLEAGKPYIFQASAETLNVTYGDEEANSPVENGALRGTFENLNATALAAKADKVYILINNSIRPAGSENSLGANRAYINYNALTVGTPAPAPGRRVRAIPMQPQVATGIEDVQGDNVQSTKVLINGQLFIFRGEKMYDATGRLVK